MVLVHAANAELRSGRVAEEDAHEAAVATVLLATAMVRVLMGSGAHGDVGPACAGGVRREEHASRRRAGRTVTRASVCRETAAPPRTPGHRLAHVSVGAAIGLGAVLGLAIGIVVSVATGVPLAPEAGLVLGALVGWLSRRNRP
jgi:hypothetical protein